MSFRIDDILNQNSSKEKINTASDNNSSQTNFNTLCSLQNTSILEHNLSYKNYINSLGHQEQLNKYPVNYCSSSRAHYLPKPTCTRYSYNRDFLWPNYMPCPILFNCQHLHNRRKGGQIRFTTSQTEELEKQFNSHKYLSPEDRKQLASYLRLSDRQVKTWFQNRRAKWRRTNQISKSRSNDLPIPINIEQNTKFPPEISSKLCDIKYY